MPDPRDDTASPATEPAVPPPALGAPEAPPATSESVLPVPAAPKAGRAPLWFLLVVTVVSLVADLWSKAWAMGYFDGVKRGDPRELVVVEGFLSLIYAKNRGGAWGLLQNENESLRRPFFLIVSVVAIVFIVSLYRRLAPNQTALKWGLPLVLGGALGNLIDRIRYGFVVDFIDMYATFGGQVKHWPTYNVADIAICVGVGLMAIDMFTPRKVKKPAWTEADSAATPSDGALAAATAPAPPAVPTDAAAPATPSAEAPLSADVGLALGDRAAVTRPETSG